MNPHRTNKRKMDRQTGIQVIDDRPVLAPHHELAIQQLGELCWCHRDILTDLNSMHAPSAPMFVYISGGVLQVDVDLCVDAFEDKIRTRSRSPCEFAVSFFADAFGSRVGASTVLRMCQDAYFYIFQNFLTPAGRDLWSEDVRMLPGRKLLLSGTPGEAQLLHMDSIWPTLVGSVYLRPQGFEKHDMRATVFPEEPDGPDLVNIQSRHPRDLRVLNVDSTLGRDSPPWNMRPDIGPGVVKHNSAVLFCGNVVHGGPAPCLSSMAEPRIVMFQSVGPVSSPTTNLSDYQEFEFSLYSRLYGACAATGRALKSTQGNWKDHYHEEDDEFKFLLNMQREVDEQLY